MEGAWIISRPLSAIGGRPVEDGPESAAAAVMRLSDFAGCLEAISARSSDLLAMWRAGETMHLADMGSLGCVVALAPTLGAALKAFQRYFGALQSASAVTFEVEGDRASFSYRILDNDIWPRRADAELTLGVIAGIIRRFVPQAERMCSLAFEHEPGAARGSFATHTAGPVRTSENNIISFPARLLDRSAEPVAVSDTTRTFRDAVQSLGAQVRADWMRQPTSHRVLHILMSRIGREPIDQDAVASQLGVSRRTLRRQLDAEGRSFLELTEICRRNLGHALLVRSELPMIEIAMRLGYSDHTAFSRAFSRWFGASPRELRKAGSATRVTT